MNERLKLLADKLGILTEYYDAGQDHKRYETSEDTIKFFAQKLGYNADTDKDIEHSLVKFENRRWQETLEPVYVIEQGNLNFDIVTLSSQKDGIISIKATSRQNGEEFNIPSHIIGSEERDINHRSYIRQTCSIDKDLEVGYYDLTVTIEDKDYKSVLAVAPAKCYENAAVDNGRLWGYALQLYAMKSKRNWGVGDFTDLKNFAKIAAQSGADIIGLNPLNVLSHDFPENASPYQSISRLYLNPIYIDVENVPEFKQEDMAEVKNDIEEFRQSELIQYEHIYPLKVKMLQKCYERFKQNNNSARYQEFEAYIKAEGCELERLAVFQSLYHKFALQNMGGWQSWPEEYKSPNSLAVKEYAKANVDELNFFKFMQFEAARQFEEASQAVKNSGMKIGLYRDLAVGVGQDSVEVWSEPDLFFKDAGAGAPPDAMFPNGQKWGLGAFIPSALRETAYKPFIKILRANMHNSGALRIDHVMSLMRLFIIPEHLKIGTYIFYNFKDMLNIVALESVLNKCAIVGESLGNVPEGFLEALESKNIYALSVLWLERYNDAWGDFKAPEAYPSRAFSSIGTHDMAPLKMWWFGYDIELSYQLGIIESEENKNAEYKSRENDRWRLLKILDETGVWPQDKPRKGNYIYGEGYPEGIEEAANAYMAKTNCPVFLAELENILHVKKRQNLPGTDRDQHPNWRRRLPVELEKLAEDIAYVRNIKAINAIRN